MNTSWQPGMTLEDIERSAIEKAYSFYRNNKTQTSKALGIAVRTLDSKLAKYQEIDDAKKERLDAVNAKRLLDLQKHRGPHSSNGVVGVTPPDEPTGDGKTEPTASMPQPRGRQSQTA